MKKVNKKTSKTNKNINFYFNESLKKARDNKVLFIPSLLSMVVSGILVMVFLILTGFFRQFFALIANPVGIDKSFKEALVSKLLTSKYLILIFFIFIILIIIFSVVMKCAQLYMTKELIRNKKVKFMNSLKNAKGFVWKYVGLSIIRSLMIIAIIFLAIFLIAFIAGLLYQVMPVLGIIIGIMLAILTIFGIIVLGLGVMFSTPILFIESTPAIEAIKKSFSYFRQNPKQVFVTFLILIGTGMLVNVITRVLTFLNVFIANAFLSFTITLIILVIGLILNVWQELFIFSMYKKEF